MTRGIVMSQGGAAQITTPFWLPDSHVYEPGLVGDAQIQASAAIQSATEYGQILEVGAALGEDPQNSGALRVYVAVTAAARVPLGVSYRVTVICGTGALRPPTA